MPILLASFSVWGRHLSRWCLWTPVSSSHSAICQGSTTTIIFITTFNSARDLPVSGFIIYIYIYIYSVPSPSPCIPPLHPPSIYGFPHFVSAPPSTPQPAHTCTSFHLTLHSPMENLATDAVLKLGRYALLHTPWISMHTPIQEYNVSWEGLQKCNYSHSGSPHNAFHLH